MRIGFLFAVLLAFQGVYAQQDTVRIPVISKADSVFEAKQKSIDSVQQQILQLLQIKIASDTSRSLQRLRQEKFALQQKVDSLTRIGQPNALLQQKLDSLNTLRPLRTLDSLNQQLSQLQQKIQDPISKVEGAINKQVQNINTFTANQVPLELTTAATTLPTSSSLPTTIPSANANIPKVNTRTENLKPDLELPKEIQQGKDQLGKIGELSSSVDAYQKDIQQIKEGGLGQSTELSALAEKQLGSIDEVSALKEELGKSNLPVEGLDEESAKAMLKEQAKGEAVKLAKDHFAGKQQALAGAMAKMSDLKLKYESLDSLTVPKRMNPMKGKKWTERIVTGLSFQVQRSQNWLVDVNPSLAYLITRRFSAGLGWNQRIGFGSGASYQKQEEVYGPRIFSEFRWNKGISFRLEGENQYGIPVASFATPKNKEDQYRWINSVQIGLKKDYQIVNRLRGTLFILYLVYDDNMSSPYANKLNTRFGFEYKLRK